MAGKVVVDAVTARLKANWSLCPVVDDDTTGQGTSDGKPYVTLEFPVAVEQQITIGAPGANVFRESGVIRIKLVSPTGDGLSQATDWIDQLRAIFRGKQFSGITTYAPSPGVIDNSNYQAGKFVISTACPYYFDLFA